MLAETVELDNEAWQAERDAATRRFLNMSADEFVERYQRGDFDNCEPDGLMAVLGFFPELD